MSQNRFGWLPHIRKKSQSVTVELQAIDGHEEYRQPLSVINISYIFCSLKDLTNSANIQLFSEELKVPSEVVVHDISNITGNMNEGMVCCIEYPYVEEYYRDSYYSFYSRKHIECNRNCFRVSFFSTSVNEDNYYETELSDKFYGYMVLRPTPNRIVGYTFLSPQAYKDKSFSICICKRSASIMGRTIDVVGFPFCGQDSEMNTCAENAIMVMFDYFSRRYNKYSRVLPGIIASQLSDSCINRKQPSLGLDIDTISTIIENMGMATRKYTRKDYGDKFSCILQIYVESGIPVYAATDTHAFLIIGRRNQYSEKDIRYICMNDNERPYSHVDSVDDIAEFIVPVSENLLLNAENLDFDGCIKSFHDAFPNIKLLPSDTKYYHRVYLTTSRSYKAYIADSQLSKENKDLAICIAMPRFIWVCESIPRQSAQYDVLSNTVDLIVVIDATAHISGYNHLLLVKTKEKLIFPTTDKTRLQRKTYSISDSKESMTPFLNNLKGEHTKWQG